MELRDLRARIERLDQLIRGLGIEKSRWLKCDAPVYLWEREEYRVALDKATDAVQAVRRVLVKVCSRIDKGECAVCGWRGAVCGPHGSQVALVRGECHEPCSAPHAVLPLSS
jgi:hypothetical protein